MNEETVKKCSRRMELKEKINIIIPNFGIQYFQYSVYDFLKVFPREQ